MQPEHFTIIGLIVNFLAIIHFFNKLEHRLTRTEIHILHIMRNQNMKVREADLETDFEE